MIHKLSAFVFLFCAFSLIAQSPVDGFFKGAQHLDVGIGAGIEKSSKYFAGTEKIGIGRDIKTASLFAGYGILEGLDIYTSIPYVQINDVKGMQDGSVYLKARVFKKDYAAHVLSFSLAAGASTYLSDYETEGGSAIGQQNTAIDIRPILHVQKSNGYFLTAQGGYQLKSEPTPDSYQANLKIGYAATKFYADFWYAYQASDGGLDYRGEVAVNSFKQLGVDYHKAGATYYRPITESLGAFANISYVLSGRNISQGQGFGLGVVWKAIR